MDKSDDDIAELDRLLGGAKVEYRALRHTGPIPEGRGPRRIQSIRRYAVAASVLIVCGGLVLGLLGSDGGAPSPSRLAMPQPAAVPLTLRPQTPETARLSLDRSGLGVSSTLPPRPTRSDG